MARKMLVEVVADCLPMTTLCGCPETGSWETGSCTYCLNLANELIYNLWNQGFKIVRRGEDG